MIDFSENSFGFVDVLHFIQRKFKDLVFAFILFFAVFLILVFNLEKKYTSTSKVLIDKESSQIDLGQIVNAINSESSLIETNKEILKTDTLSYMVINELDLANNDYFEDKKSFIKTLLKSTLSFFSNDDITEKYLSKKDKHTLDLLRISNRLSKMVEVSRSGLSYIINISVTSTDPSLSSDIANSYANNFLLFILESKFKSAQVANNWLSERLKVLQSEVQVAEKKVEEFRTNAGILETGEVGGATLRQQQISDLNLNKININSEYIEKRERLRTILAQIDAGKEGISEALNSRVIQDLRNKLSESSRRLADLSSRYGEKHPEILKTREEINDLQNGIDAEINRIVDGLRSDVNVARSRLNIINNDIESLKLEIAEENTSLVKLRELERNAEATRTLYENFLDRFKQTSEQQNLYQSDAKIISNATIPNKPSFPNYILMIMLSIIASSILSFALVSVIEEFRQSVISSDDIRSAFNVEVISEIPLLEKSDTKNVINIVNDKPFSVYSESIRKISTFVTLNMKEADSNIVAISSSVSSEGKTTTSISLAQIAVQSGFKTLLIDADVRKKSLTTALVKDQKISKNFLDLLKEEKIDQNILKKYLLPTSSKDLFIIPMGDSSLEKGAYKSADVNRILPSLKPYFDLIIMDCAPVSLVSDTKVILKNSGNVIILSRWDKTSKSLIKNTLSELKSVDVNISGFVLSAVNFEKLKSDYRYGNIYQTYSDYYRN